jgi:predicted DNA-binding transcriptional regulator AlpA
MSSPEKKVIPLRTTDGQDDKRLIVTMNVGELRQLVRQEVQAVSGGGALQTDEWVDIETAAKLMGVSPEWIYHNRKTLPFASKIGRRLLRFSRVGLQQWMESKKP